MDICCRSVLQKIVRHKRIQRERVNYGRTGPKKAISLTAVQGKHLLACSHADIKSHFPLQVSVDELKALLAKYSSTDQLAQSGLTIANTKYMYLSSSDKVVRAKKGTSGCHCIKTTQGEWCLYLLESDTG